jgi:hypothetical protein
MVEKQFLLDTKQMAQFAANGFLRFDELIPDEINRAACEEMDAGGTALSGNRAGTCFDDIWADSRGAGALFRLPQVRGIIESLVGPRPLYDHHAIHIVRGGHTSGQFWHGDAIIDTRLHFDIQFFYFAHDTPREMGGTMILPGSHYRLISESDIARYQNFTGQLPMVCKAGTLVVVHHGIWHCAQPNLTDRTRYMFKVRLNPTVRQMKLWNTDDINDPEIQSILGTGHSWYGNEGRIEVVNRIRFWRFLTGDDQFDVHYWLTRLENKPENRLQRTGDGRIALQA